MRIRSEPGDLRADRHPIRQALRLFHLCRQITPGSSPERVRAQMFGALGLSDNLKDMHR